MKSKVLIGLILVIASCQAKTWSDEDTVVIDAFGNQDSAARRHRQISVPGVGIFPSLPGYPQGGIRPIGGSPGGIGSCYAANGETGQCATLKQCYPIVYSIEKGEEDMIVNEGLAEFLKNSSGPCTAPVMPNYFFFRADAETRQNFICCTSQNPKPPIIRPVTRPTMRTTQRPVNYPRPPSPTPAGRPTRPPADAPKVDGSSSCGGGKVVGGSVSPRGKHPWIVALTNNGRQFCGGSLIDSNHVLTAAHCVSHMTANDIARLRVHLGEHTIGVSENTEQIEKVTRVLYHRGFSHQTLHNDVAILKLAAPARESTSNYIQRVCLAKNPTQTFANNQVTLAGWGQIRDGGPQSSVLREVTMRVWSNDECKRSYQGKAPAGIVPSMICAASNGKDACRGDSGGPLVYENPKNVFTQVGVVSWGIGCGSYPGVYSRVSHFLSWIEKNTKTK